MIVFNKIAVSASGIEGNPLFPWLAAASCMLFFALVNSVFGLASKSYNDYWGKSMTAYIILTICSALTAYLISSVWINDASSYRWIFIVVTIGYIVFMAIIGMMRAIVRFAQSEVWTSPKQRKKKK
jgi:Ca2+/Na+ antiporter